MRSVLVNYEKDSIDVSLSIRTPKRVIAQLHRTGVPDFLVNEWNLASKSLSKVSFPFCQVSLSPSQLNNLKEVHSLMSPSLKLLLSLHKMLPVCLTLLLFHFFLHLFLSEGISILLVFADDSILNNDYTARKIPFMYSFSGICAPQFQISCVCERFIKSQDQSTYFLAAE